MASQLAGSVLLLVLAGLFLRSVLQARSVAPGYAVDGIHAYRPRLSELGYGRAEGVAFFNEFRARVAALPGVESAALVLGLVAGLLLAGASATVVRSQLFGLSPLDPIAFGGAITLLGGAAVLAMYRPTRRAAGLDPATTLRDD